MEPEELEEIVALYVAAEIDAVSVTDFPTTADGYTAERFISIECKRRCNQNGNKSNQCKCAHHKTFRFTHNNITFLHVGL